MKFKLRTTADYYENKEEVARLRKLGFVFTMNPRRYMREAQIMINNDVDMEINTLEELLSLADNYGELIVKRGTIEIYDDDRE